MVHYGSYAMNVMRIEKAYKAMGSELTTEITPVEADIGRFVDDSNAYLGQAAVADRRSMGDDIEMICVYCEVDADDNDCRGNEPIYAGDEQIGLTTSGAYGHSVGKSLAFAYVTPQYKEPGSQFEIQLMGERRAATVLAEPAWDPKSERLRV